MKATRGLGFATVLGVYEGDSLPGLIEAGSDRYGMVSFETSAGTTYIISAVSYSDEIIKLEIELSPIPPPNDDFDNATDLVMTSGLQLAGSIRGATREPNEPDHHSDPSQSGSVWYRWTPPQTMLTTLTVDAEDESFSELVSVYAGTPVGGLTPIASGAETTMFRAEAGVPVHFAVSGTIHATEGDFSLQLETTDYVANDDFEAATDLGAVNSVNVSGDLELASRQIGEPDHHNDSSQSGSVWYRWTAPQDQFVELQVVPTGGNYTDLMAIYQGSSLGALTLVGSTIRSNPEKFFATAGTTYHIAVAANQASRFGTFDLMLESFDIHPNDDFDDALDLGQVLATTIQASNFNTTRETTEPFHEGDTSQGGSVWFRWTAPQTFFAQMDVPGSSDIIEVYTGASLDQLTPVVSYFNSSGPRRFITSAGTTYHIAVATSSIGRETEFELELETNQFHPHDDFSNARNLGSVTSAEVIESNYYSTRQAAEPSRHGQNSNPGGSIWFRWTAPANLFTTIELGAQGSVYTGSSLGSLNKVLEFSFFNNNEFLATAGTTYHIAAESSSTFSMHDLYLGLSTNPLHPQDAFANAADLGETTNTVIQASLSYMTREPGEPDHGDSSPHGSIWWNWTAPANLHVSLETGSGAIQNDYVAVYTGNSVNNLTEIANSGPRGGIAFFEASAGTTYRIAVANAFTAHHPIEFRVRSSPVTDNDNLADAFNLGSITGGQSQHGTTIGATREAAEPVHNGRPGQGGSVWYSWTAPSNLWATFTTVDEPLSTSNIGVYTGDDMASLDPVARGIGGNGGPFLAVSGTTYKIAIAMSSNDGAFRLHLASQPNLGNDDFANAIDLGQANNISLPAATYDATRETNEPLHAGDSSTNGSVWWTWTAATDADVEISVANHSFMITAVYTGSDLANLVEIDAAIFSNPVSFRAQAGTTYRIAVSGSEKFFDLNLTATPPPPNDDFANAVDLGSDPSLSATGTNRVSSREANEPLHRNSLGGSVWWKWIAPADLAVEIAVRSTPVHVAVYRGSQLGSLTLVGADSDVARFLAKSGETYYIAVFGRNETSESTILLDLDSVALQQPNDSFSTATDLGNAPSATDVGNLENSHSEPGEPNHNGQTPHYGSVWWSWTAPSTAGARVRIVEGGFSRIIAIYTGETLDTLTEIISGTYGPDLGFLVEAGTTYHFAGTSHVGNDVTDFTISLETAPLAPNDDFENRIQLTGALPVTGSGNNFAASAEPLEPNHDGYQADASLWWEWTAPQAGSYLVKTEGSAFIPRIAVYRQAPDNSLQAIESGIALISFEALAGEQILIAIDSLRTRGYIEMAIETAPPAATNDDFANSISIFGAAPQVVGNNIGTTFEISEPRRIAEMEHSVWWSWLPPAPGDYVIDTSGTDFEHEISVYTGSRLNRLQLIPLREDGTVLRVYSSGTRSVHHFVVSGIEAGSMGNIDWSIEAASPVPAPVNDYFTDRIDLGNAEAMITSQPIGNASREIDEPSHSSSYGSIWWSWTAPSTGRFRIDSQLNSSGAPLCAVYEGLSLDELLLVTSGKTSVAFDTVAGTTYSLAFAPDRNVSPTTTLDFSISLNAGGVVPGNDDFTSRSILGTEIPQTVQGSLANATVETDEPTSNLQHSVWWEFTAPSTMPIVLTASQHDLAIEIYTGENLSTQTSVSSGIGVATFDATAGTRYQIAVAHSNDLSGDFDLAVGSPPANDNFAAATALIGGNVETTGNDLFATNEAGEPIHRGDSSQGGSLWWTWQADANAVIDLSAESANSSSLNLAVYIGSEVGLLTPVGSGSHNLQIQVNAGQLYHIATSSATYGGAGGAGQVSLSIRESPLRPYQLWSLQFFTGGSAEGLPGADPDFDNLDNLLEYALATDPTAPSNRSHFPHASYPDSGDRAFTYVRNLSATDLEFSYEISTDLTTWLPATIGEQIDELSEENADGTETITVVFGSAFAAKPRLFLRLIVTPNS